METIEELLVKAKKATAERERAKALEGYAVHNASCKRAFNSEQPCTCGLDRLLKGGDVAMTPQDIDPAKVGLTGPEPAKAEVGAQFNPNDLTRLVNYTMLGMAKKASDKDAEIATLRAEPAKAKEDSEMLDWLNEYGRVAKFSDGWNAWDTLYNRGAFIRDDIRQAIRSAIAAGKESKPCRTCGRIHNPKTNVCVPESNETI
jgi:hypothetical protein